MATGEDDDEDQDNAAEDRSASSNATQSLDSSVSLANLSISEQQPLANHTAAKKTTKVINKIKKVLLDDEEDFDPSSSSALSQDPSRVTNCSREKTSRSSKQVAQTKIANQIIDENLLL